MFAALLAVLALSTGTASAGQNQATKIDALQERVQHLRDRTERVDARRVELRTQRDAAVAGWWGLDRTIWAYDHQVAPLPTEILEAQRAARDLISEALQGEWGIAVPWKPGSAGSASQSN
jgi:hypothetical protein